MKQIIYAWLFIVAIHVVASFIAPASPFTSDQLLLYFVVGAVAALIFRKGTYE